MNGIDYQATVYELRRVRHNRVTNTFMEKYSIGGPLRKFNLSCDPKERMKMRRFLVRQHSQKALR